MSVSNPPGRWTFDQNGSLTYLGDAKNIDLQGKKIVNIGQPSKPQDVATKRYADDAAPAFNRFVESQDASNQSVILEGVSDGSGSLWTSSSDGQKIYNINQSGEVIKEFPTPTSSPGSTAIDQATGCIWQTSFDASIFKMNQTGSIVTKFASPDSNPAGIDVEANGCLWVTDNLADSIFRLNQSGSITKQITHPSASPADISIDNRNSSLWVVDTIGPFTSGGSIYLVDQTGFLVQQYSTPDDGPYGIALDETTGCLWHTSDTTGSVYKLNQSASVVAGFKPTANSDLSGVDISDLQTLNVRRLLNLSKKPEVNQNKLVTLTHSSIYGTAFGSSSITAVGLNMEGVQATAQVNSVTAIPASGCLWHADFGSDEILKMDQSGNVSTSFTVPGDGPIGIDYDETTDSIFYADLNGSIYPLDSSGGQTGPAFTLPNTGDPRGVDINESTGCVWATDDQDGTVFKMDQSGNNQGNFSTPGGSPRGIDVDESTGCLWHADSGDASIYRLNQSGSIVSQIPSPESSPIGVDVDEVSGCVWTTDSNTGSVYKMDQSGSVISGFDSPASDTQGIDGIFRDSVSGEPASSVIDKFRLKFQSD